MTDLIYVLISFVFVFLIIGASTMLKKIKMLSSEGARKFVHIGVAHWWFFVFFFENIWFALVAPAAFIALNFISYRQHIFKVIERDDQDSFGTVYYPISLFILVALTFLIGEPKSLQYIGAIAMMILGYGDGFAAIIGKRFRSKTFLPGKSVAGSLTMVIASLIVTSLMIGLYQPEILYPVLFVVLVSVSATVIEMFTRHGLDNLSVPLGVAILSYLYIVVTTIGG
jgi:phytol kinase